MTDDPEIPFEPDWNEVVNRHADALFHLLPFCEGQKQKQAIIERMKLLVNELTAHWY